MASFWQRAQLYLGLVDEEELNNEAGVGQAASTVQTTAPLPPTTDSPAGRRVEPPLGARRSTVAEPAYGEPSVVVRSTGTGAVRAVPPVEVQSEVVVAVDFADAKLLADRIRERTPVVLNLRDTDPDMVRRLVDFASGLTYALDGTMRRISEGVILVLPPRMSLGREEKRRLVELGLYRLPDAEG